MLLHTILQSFDAVKLIASIVSSLQQLPNCLLTNSCLQGVKLRLIQAPMRLNFSLWRPNPENQSSNWLLGKVHHDLTKRYSELKRFAKINPRQTSLLSLFPKRSTCISIDNKTPSWIQVSLNVVYYPSQCPLCSTLKILSLT